MMSKQDRLLKRFLSKPKDFTYQELKRLLGYFGYVEDSAGRTSGSRVSFKNPLITRPILVHKPHPEKEMKPYQLVNITKELRNQGFIE